MILVRGGIKIRMREQELDEQSREQDFKRDVAMLLLKREDRETRETETDRQRERESNSFGNLFFNILFAYSWITSTCYF
jgi:hypothetical protein